MAIIFCLPGIGNKELLLVEPVEDNFTLPTKNTLIMGLGDSIIEVNQRLTYAYNAPNTWPLSSPYRCMWCCHQHDNVPIFTPQVINHVTITGPEFCSFECAAAYLDDKGECKELLYWLHRTMTGTISPIVSAPPRTTLREFGGDLDIETFRAPGAKYQVIPGNIRFLPERIVEEISVGHIEEGPTREAISRPQAKIVQKTLF